MATKDKVICPVCQREEKRSKVILSPGQALPEMKFTKGYWNENGDFIMPDVDFEPPWYICSNGHITQTFSR
jgi:hypothetical protein